MLFRVCLLSAMAAVLVLTACGGGDEATPTVTRASPTAAPTAARLASTPTPAPTATPIPSGPAAPAIKRGGVLKQGDKPSISASFQAGFRNPQLGPVNSLATKMVYLTLFQHDPYDKHAFKGLLAAGWQLSPTADQLTIRLNPQARWADGKPLVVEDVKFSLDHYANPPAGYTALGTVALIGKSIKSVEIVDPANVRINLKEPDVSLLAQLADPDVAIRPAHRTLEQSAREPVGTGPFQVKDIQTDVKMVFVKNPNFWMKDAQGGALPYLDGVENTLILDPSQAYAAVLTGQVDVLPGVGGWGAGTISGKEDDIARRMPNAVLQVRYSGIQGWGLKNTPPWDNVNVRRALSILTDRITFVELGMGRAGVADGTGAMSASSGSEWGLPLKEIMARPGWRHINRKTGELELSALKLTELGTAVYEKDPKDIELGLQMLRQAGMDPDKGQFPKLTLLANQQYETYATALAGTLQKVLKTTIALDIVDVATSGERYSKGTFEGVVANVTTGAFDPSPMILPLTTGNGTWKHGFQTPELDALFAQQKREVDPVKRRELVWQFQRQYLDGATMISGANFRGATGVVREWVKNFPTPVLISSNAYGLERVTVER